MQAARNPETTVAEPAWITRDGLAQWAECLPDLLTAGAAQQRKTLMRKLIKEIRVMSRDEIAPTYRIPAAGSRSVRFGRSGPPGTRTLPAGLKVRCST